MATSLQANKRGVKPQSVIRKIRQSGKVPAVIYGKGTENLTIAVDEIEMRKILRDEGNYAVLKLNVDEDQSYQVMVYDVQRDPIKGSLTHIDFKTIRMDEMVQSEVNVEVTGEPAGEEEGGVLQHTLRALEIRSLPGERPDVITCDVSDLNIGDSITVGDLNIPEGVEVVNDPQDIVATVVPPAQEEPETEDEPATEPELVDEKEEDEEEDATS